MTNDATALNYLMARRRQLLNVSFLPLLLLWSCDRAPPSFLSSTEQKHWWVGQGMEYLYIYIKVSIFWRTILYIYVGDINIRLLFSSTSMNNCLLYTTDHRQKKKHLIWSNLGWKVITRARVHCVWQISRYTVSQSERAKFGYSLVWYTLNIFSTILQVFYRESCNLIG